MAQVEVLMNGLVTHPNDRGGAAKGQAPRRLDQIAAGMGAEQRQGYRVLARQAGQGPGHVAWAALKFHIGVCIDVRDNGVHGRIIV